MTKYWTSFWNGLPWERDSLSSRCRTEARSRDRSQNRLQKWPHDPFGLD